MTAAGSRVIQSNKEIPAEAIFEWPDAAKGCQNTSLSLSLVPLPHRWFLFTHFSWGSPVKR